MKEPSSVQPCFAVEFGINPDKNEKLKFRQILAQDEEMKAVWDGVRNRNYYSER